jgi:hypothetical protein
MDLLNGSNTRDKMLILAMLWIATLVIVLVGILCLAGKYTEATALFTAVSTIAGTFAGAYKGLPTESTPTSATTESETQTTTKTSTEPPK